MQTSKMSRVVRPLLDQVMKQANLKTSPARGLFTKMTPRPISALTSLHTRNYIGVNYQNEDDLPAAPQFGVSSEQLNAYTQTGEEDLEPQVEHFQATDSGAMDLSMNLSLFSQPPANPSDSTASDDYENFAHNIFQGDESDVRLAI